MPEYLAPGVYVEEVDTGNKPIEGVSTSTAGVVGVTERGPVNVPVFISSRGEFERIFGDVLDHDAFTHNGRSHAYLPHAVDGFFTNGGRRMFVVRVAPEAAEHSSRLLFARGDMGVGDTRLLRSAARDTGTLANPPLLYALDTTSINDGDWVRIGEGSRAEYHVVNVHDQTLVAMQSPLDANVPPGEDVVTYQLDSGNLPPAQHGTLDADAPAGAGLVQIDLAGTPQPGDVLVIGPPALEVRRIGAVSGAGPFQVDFERPLDVAHAAGEAIEVYQPGQAGCPAVGGGTLELEAPAGALVVFSDAPGFDPAEVRIVGFGAAPPHDRFALITQLAEVPLNVALDDPLPAGARVNRVELVRHMVGGVTADTLIVPSGADLFLGMTIVVNATEHVIETIDAANLAITVDPDHTVAAGSETDVTRPPSALAEDTIAGTNIVVLDDRSELQNGDLIQVGTGNDVEFASVIDVVAPLSDVAPDAGSVVLDRPLLRPHSAGEAVEPRFAPDRDIDVGYMALPAEAGTDAIAINDHTAVDFGDVIQLVEQSGQRHYHSVAAPPVSLDQSHELELDNEVLRGAHDLGAPVAPRHPLLEVRALDAGGWGNRLRIAVEDETQGLASRAHLTDIDQVQNTLRLTTLTGVEPGTILAIEDPDTGEQIDVLLKVRSIDPTAGNLVVLDGPGVTGAHVLAFTAAMQPLRVRSREFRISVFLLRRPDPAVPTRNDTVIASELFRHLSMDHRHSRYVETIIGRTELVPGEELRRWDRRTHGESAYIRVFDQAANDAEREAVRIGPETLVDVLPSGRTRAARHPLFDGDDLVSAIVDQTYVGDDDVEPELRTGLYSLNNEDDISLVAIPGQTTQGIQQALIDHCELDRYRFAVLDALGPPNDALVDVQTQRQQFDTKYAALYHPWLLIPDPLPDNLQAIERVAIAPSGHILGVVARTDVERGVHKAPANEVVRGIVGLQRSLNKAEHDILNPSPVNINVIRDFRPNNRGIRVWGARVITSDTDWKYVNVRRLLIFLEKSIDRGLQWVVFEPNHEPTWARVRRSIGNFLTVVHRNGALEGERPEEGFFVKCDRTTMTQTDIDNGRLIAVVGVAPVKPAEYVIIRIGLWTANANN